MRVRRIIEGKAQFVTKSVAELHTESSLSTEQKLQNLLNYLYSHEMIELNDLDLDAIISVESSI